MMLDRAAFSRAEDIVFNRRTVREVYDALRAYGDERVGDLIASRERVREDVLECFTFLIAALPDSAETARHQLIAAQGVVSDYFDVPALREPWGPSR